MHLDDVYNLEAAIFQSFLRERYMVRYKKYYWQHISLSLGIQEEIV